jgi:hypothetical protein
MVNYQLILNTSETDKAKLAEAIGPNVSDIASGESFQAHHNFVRRRTVRISQETGYLCGLSLELG